MDVCHRCDNPACINPDHLFSGTRKENMDDRDSKGRNRPGRGEAVGTSKLTEVDVISMRRLRQKGLTFDSIAQRFGVAKKTALQAIKGEQWAHVPPPPTEKDKP
jgi:hypothetical protein